MIVSLGRWCLKDTLLVTVTNTLLCTFIVQVSWEKKSIEQIALFQRWSWKGHLFITIEKVLLCMFFVQVSQETDLSGYESVIGKMVLKRPFVSYLEEDTDLHVHCSGLQGDRTLSGYGNLSEKLVSKSHW